MWKMLSWTILHDFHRSFTLKFLGILNNNQKHADVCKLYGHRMAIESKEQLAVICNWIFIPSRQKHFRFQLIGFQQALHTTSIEISLQEMFWKMSTSGFFTDVWILVRTGSRGAVLWGVLGPRRSLLPAMFSRLSAFCCISTSRWLITAALSSCRTCWIGSLIRFSAQFTLCLLWLTHVNLSECVKWLRSRVRCAWLGRGKKQTNKKDGGFPSVNE